MGDSENWMRWEVLVDTFVDEFVGIVEKEIAGGSAAND